MNDNEVGCEMVGFLAAVGSLQLHRNGNVRFVLSRPRSERGLCELIKRTVGGGTLYFLPPRGNWRGQWQLYATGKTRRSIVYRYASIVASSEMPTAHVKIARLLIEYMDGGAIEADRYRRLIGDLRTRGARKLDIMKKAGL